jgi:hypothetical protein
MPRFIVPGINEMDRSELSPGLHASQVTCAKCLTQDQPEAAAKQKKHAHCIS